MYSHLHELALHFPTMATQCLFQTVADSLATTLVCRAHIGMQSETTNDNEVVCNINASNRDNVMTDVTPVPRVNSRINKASLVTDEPIVPLCFFFGAWIRPWTYPSANNITNASDAIISNKIKWFKRQIMFGFNETRTSATKRDDTENDLPTYSTRSSSVQDEDFFHLQCVQLEVVSFRKMHRRLAS